MKRTTKYDVLDVHQATTGRRGRGGAVTIPSNPEPPFQTCRQAYYGRWSVHPRILLSAELLELALRLMLGLSVVLVGWDLRRFVLPHQRAVQVL